MDPLPPASFPVGFYGARLAFVPPQPSLFPPFPALSDLTDTLVSATDADARVDLSDTINRGAPLPCLFGGDTKVCLCRESGGLGR